jgi:putative tRNA adenosine deaminase-associated protein
MSADEDSVNDFEDLPDLADGDDRPGVNDDLEYFDEPADGVDVDDEDDEDDDDYPEDATDDDLDFAIAVYREDGEPAAQPLALETANDLEELMDALRRLPGDGGALAAVSIVEDFFVLVRVRGKLVQAFLSDVFAANDWPIARDVCDYLGVDLPDEDDDDDDPSPVGDLNILADLGLSELDLQSIATDIDESTDELALIVLDRIGLGELARTVVEAEFS